MKQRGKFQLFSLIEFSDWVKGLEVLRSITILQNHHTYIPDYKNFLKRPDHFFWVESMERGHLERGFDQIAQQITTFPDGMICIGRPFEKIPAGIKGANAQGVCMEHLGNFDIGADTMTEDHKKTIVGINAILCKKFTIQPTVNGIVYHHWYDLNTGVRVKDFSKATTKTCPGTNFFGGNTEEACTKNFIPQIDRLVNSTK